MTSTGTLISGRRWDDDLMARELHLDRIARTLGSDGGLFARLAALEAADVRALLLDLASRRAASLRPVDVLQRYSAAASLQPASVEPARSRDFESWAMDMLPDGFVELELAPHAPLGVSSVLGGFSQDRVLATIADSEVVSDSTNVLALECAVRRRAPTVRRHAPPVKLAASHRLLRPREGVHFGLVALCTAGRDRGSFSMQIEALREHVGWHVGVITGQAPQLPLEVRVTDLSDGVRRDVLREQLLRPLQAEWPAVSWSFDDDREAGRGYYTEVCFAAHAVHADGSRSFLSDGGFTDWTARLLADRKERLLISGLGSERLLGLGGPRGGPA